SDIELREFTATDAQPPQRFDEATIPKIGSSQKQFPHVRWFEVIGRGGELVLGCGHSVPSYGIAHPFFEVQNMVVLLCCRCCQAPVGFCPFLFLGRFPLVQSRLVAMVDTQLRLTHVLPPMRVQPRSIPLALFPPLT